MGSVAREKERGTAGMILTKPASRPRSCRPSSWPSRSPSPLAVTLACVVGAIYTVLLFDNASLPVDGIVAMAILLWLAIFAYASLTFRRAAR